MSFRAEMESWAVEEAVRVCWAWVREVWRDFCILTVKFLCFARVLRSEIVVLALATNSVVVFLMISSGLGQAGHLGHVGHVGHVGHLSQVGQVGHFSHI